MFIYNKGSLEVVSVPSGSHKKHKKHKKKHKKRDEEDEDDVLDSPKAPLKLKLKIGAQTVSTKK